MEVHLDRTLSRVQFEGNQPGCLWGILHFLDYHHVKNKLTRYRQGGGRHARSKVSAKTSLKKHDIEAQGGMDSAAEPSLVERYDAEASPANTQQRSGKSHTKKSIPRYWDFSHAARIWLRRIIPVQHLQLSDKYRREVHPDSGFQKSSLPLTSDELVPDKKCSLGNQKVTKADQRKNNQFNDCVDVLDIFEVNKESFLKILQETSIGTKHFHGLQNSNPRARLTKSVSYPTPNSIPMKNVGLRTLKHKQGESWIFPKGEKQLSASQSSGFGTSKTQKEYHFELATNNSIGSGTQELSYQGWNHHVVNRFKEIKQRIKHALMENRKESNHKSAEALTESDPYAKVMSKRPEIFLYHRQSIDKSRSSNDVNASDYDPSKGRPSHIRRSSSLNESVDRYAELFQRSFGREAKWLQSKSLKLTNESKFPSGGRPPKSVRRRLSLPDLDSFTSFLNELSIDALSTEMKARTDAHSAAISENEHHGETKTISTPFKAQTIETRHDVLETEVIESGCNIQSSEDPTVGGNDEETENRGAFSASAIEKSSLLQDTGLAMNHSRELEHPWTEVAEPGPHSDHETWFPHDITTIAELLIHEGPVFNPTIIQMDEQDTSVDQQNKDSRDSLPAFCGAEAPESTEIPNKGDESQCLHFHWDELDDAAFNYVRVVLELSGFIKTKHLGAWYSLEQPLSPSLFKELESLLLPESEDCREETDDGDDRRLLFDLINDTLIEIYERSFTYFPKAFSFNHHIRPMPMGDHLLEEVWAKVSSYRSLRPELDQSLDDVVGRDLWKGDGWKSLQFDDECVALELEDLIFEELLDELMYS